MFVISVLNQKGGAGKTTIATHLAKAYQILGNEVLLIDSDPQGSARDWAASNENQPVSVIGIDRPNIEKSILTISKGKDIIVIDGAPQIAELSVSAIKASNFILIPVQPSPYDLWATSDLVDLVKQRMEITEGRVQAAFVVSRVIKGTKMSKQIAQVISGYDLPVLNTRITQRVVYPSSASNGLTAFDIDPHSEASNDFMNLIKEIEDMRIKLFPHILNHSIPEAHI